MQSIFLPRTALAPDEQRVNFTLMDNPVIDLLTSPEAERACSKMWLIYTRLKRADWKLWERPGQLVIHGDGKRTAWEILRDLSGVADATLSKALKWMKEHKVIAYFAGKNGAGIRICFNVALNSIKPRQKNLRLVPTSSGAARTAANEAPSCDSEAITKNIQNSDIRGTKPRENDTPAADEPAPEPLPLFPDLDQAVPPESPPDPKPSAPSPQVAPAPPRLHLVPRTPAVSDPKLDGEMILVSKAELEQTVEAITARLLEWMEKRGLPKAVRVWFAEWYRKQAPPGRGAGASSADVGKSQPQVDLHDYEAELQAEEWATQALAALPPEVVEANLAALEEQARSDPRYAKVVWADSQTKREHFAALLKRQLLTEREEKNQ